MRFLRLLLARILGHVRYFHIGCHASGRIETGVATLIRKKGKLFSYLYLSGEQSPPDEPVPETPFFWGRWLDVDMRPYPYLRDRGSQLREIDELEAFLLIRRASAGNH